MNENATSTIKPHGHAQRLRGPDTPWGRLRLSLGLSQRQVEEMTGISRGVISMIEHGRASIRPEEAAKLLALYKFIKGETP